MKERSDFVAISMTSACKLYTHFSACSVPDTVVEKNICFLIFRRLRKEERKRDGGREEDREKGKEGGRKKEGKKERT